MSGQGRLSFPRPFRLRKTKSAPLQSPEPYTDLRAERAQGFLVVPDAYVASRSRCFTPSSVSPLGGEPVVFPALVMANAHDYITDFGHHTHLRTPEGTHAFEAGYVHMYVQGEDADPESNATASMLAGRPMAGLVFFARDL